MKLGSLSSDSHKLVSRWLLDYMRERDVYPSKKNIAELLGISRQDAHRFLEHPDEIRLGDRKLVIAMRISILTGQPFNALPEVQDVPFQ
jgi:hypothetical protein